MNLANRPRRLAAGLVATFVLVVLLDVNSLPRGGGAPEWIGRVTSEALVPSDAMRDQLPARVEIAG